MKPLVFPTNVCGVAAAARRRCRLRRRSIPKNVESPSWLPEVADNYLMEVRSDPFESAKSHLFDTSSWGPFCDVTLTLKQARRSERGAWIKIDDYPCRQAFRHFMNLLNRAVYGAAFRRYGSTDLITARLPLLAQSRHPDRVGECPVLGVKRTSRGLGGSCLLLTHIGHEPL
jgi:hypothetical protein